MSFSCYLSRTCKRTGAEYTVIKSNDPAEPYRVRVILTNGNDHIVQDESLSQAYTAAIKWVVENVPEDTDISFKSAVRGLSNKRGNSFPARLLRWLTGKPKPKIHRLFISQDL